MALAEIASRFDPKLTRHVGSVYPKKLSDYFARKYPDTKLPHPKSTSSAELLDIDSLFISLCTELPLPRELKGRFAIYAWIGDPAARIRPWTLWVLQQNVSLPLTTLAAIEAQWVESVALPMPEIRIDVSVKME